MRIYQLLFSLIILAGLSACGEGRNNKVVISGQVRQADWPAITIGDSTVALDKEGKFNLSFTSRLDSFYTLKASSQTEIFLSPGDSLYIDFHGQDMRNTLSFSGSKTEENEYVQRQNETFEAVGAYVEDNWRELFSMDLPAFNAKVDSLHRELEKPLEEFKASHDKVETWMRMRQEMEIKYTPKLLKTLYPSQHRRLTGEQTEQLQRYYSLLREGSSQNSWMIKSCPTYQDFYDWQIRLQADELIRSGQQNKAFASLKAVDQIAGSQPLWDYFKTQAMKDFISNYGIHFLGQYYQEYLDKCTDSKGKKEVRKLYKEVQEKRQAAQLITYKSVEKDQKRTHLSLHVYKPENLQENERRSAYVFFHGGGWSTGMAEWGHTNCERYADKGMVAISVEYRLRDLHGGSFGDCVEDAKSAIRYIRAHAEELNIDPEKIVAAGFSAGGHLALSTAILEDFNSPNDDLSFSAKPQAMIARSASHDTVEDGWFSRVVGQEKAYALSPQHHISSGLPPALIIHGEKDHLVPVRHARAFAKKMEQYNNPVELYTYKTGHFFGSNKEDTKDFYQKTDNFLRKYGML